MPITPRALDSPRLILYSTAKCLLQTAAAELRRAAQLVGVHRQMKRSMARNEQNPDAIFLWIPKSAGTSIMRSLEQNNALCILDADSVRKLAPRRGIYSFGHQYVPSLLEMGLVSEDYWRRAFKFTVVRNPFDRAVSLFEYFRSLRILRPTTTFEIFCEYLAQGAYEEIGPYNHKHLSPMNPQVCWLKNSSGEIQADFIGRYESLESDMARLMGILGLPAPKLGRLNPSERGSTAKYYTPSTEKVVREAYREDFDAFGYPDSILHDDTCPDTPTHPPGGEAKAAMASSTLSPGAQTSR